MANEFEIQEDKEKFGKRYVRIYDKVNKMPFENYFKLVTLEAQIKARFKEQVKEYRKEVASSKWKLDFTNFEQEIGQP